MALPPFWQAHFWSSAMAFGVLSEMVPPPGVEVVQKPI
jgi:hypothetical protein